LAGADNAYAQAKETTKETTSEKSLYERLGGVFAIAAVLDHFSDAVVKNPVVGQKSKNPQLREWHTKNLKRLPGLKFMRTLWVCNVSGGPFQFTATKPGSTPLGLVEAHRDLRISPAEFGRCRTWTNPRLRQSPQAREGRSPGSVRRPQRRGHRRLRRGRQTRLKRPVCPGKTIPRRQSWAGCWLRADEMIEKSHEMLRCMNLFMALFGPVGSRRMKSVHG
jgi:hypothetical protein